MSISCSGIRDGKYFADIEKRRRVIAISGNVPCHSNSYVKAISSPQQLYAIESPLLAVSTSEIPPYTLHVSATSNLKFIVGVQAKLLMNIFCGELSAAPVGNCQVPTSDPVTGPRESQVIGLGNVSGRANTLMTCGLPVPYTKALELGLKLYSRVQP